MLTDTHAHLASTVFSYPGELPGIVESAAEAGVTRIVSISSDLTDSRRNVEIAAEFPGVHATVGVHPTSVHEEEEQGLISDLTGLCRKPKIVAIGEIGLDFYHPPQDGSPEAEWRARQERFFRAQIDLAVALDLPVVIHQRNSIDAVAEVMADYAGRVRAVFHCFTGTIPEAQRILDHGHLISFTGIATYPKAVEVHEAIRWVPEDRFMVETDSPYLAPVPFRGKRCEPAYTRFTAERIAELRGTTLEAIAAITTANAMKFFRLP